MIRLPMFPLETVVLPGEALPLRVFEPRYRVLLDRVVDGDGRFGTVLIERGSEVGGGDQRFSVGTELRLAGLRHLPDGALGLVALGARRLRVVRWWKDDPHPWATVEVWPDEPPAADRSWVVELRELVGEVVGDAPETPSSMDPASIVYRLAALVPLGPLDRQRLLEAPGTGERVGLLRALLAEALEVRRRLEGR